MPRPKKPSGNAISYTPKIECSQVLDKCGNKTAFIDSAVLHYSKFLAEGSVVVSAEELEVVKKMINEL